MRIDETNKDWLRARRALQADDALGCVACRGGETLTGTGRGHLAAQRELWAFFQDAVLRE